MAAKIAIAAGAVAGALAAPHHFTESFSEAEFVLTGPASPAETVTFTAALPWTNFDKLDAELAEISNPDSARYGEWMMGEQVNKLTAPLPEHRRAAKAFLAAKGAGCVDFPHSLKCTIKVADAEKLFKTKLSSFEQTTRGGKKVIRVHPNDAYAFPSELAGKVSFFSGLTHFPTVKARNGHIHATGAPAKATKNIRAGATDYFVLPETVAAFYKPGSTVGGAAAIQAPVSSPSQWRCAGSRAGLGPAGSPAAWPRSLAHQSASPAPARASPRRPSSRTTRPSTARTWRSSSPSPACPSGT